MRKTATVFAPRLDIPFKQSPIPTSRGPIAPIRTFWRDFITCLAHQLQREGWDVYVDEQPMWMITEDYVRSCTSDIVFIPHKIAKYFDVRPKNAFYYMQMVIPNLFTIDRYGWGADTSFWPLTASWHKYTPKFSELCDRASNGISKFGQPPLTSNLKLPEQFIFFPCQLPHDETIRYHSRVSVEEALTNTIIIASALKLPVVVKGHPVNPGSMAPLKHIAESFKKTSWYVEWFDQGNIHEFLTKCTAVFTVNSGVGFEALLHHKHVFTFGLADYHNAATHIPTEMIRDLGFVTNMYEAVMAYPRNMQGNFVETYYHKCFDVADYSSWGKLPSVIGVGE